MLEGTRVHTPLDHGAAAKVVPSKPVQVRYRLIFAPQWEPNT
jgi:hypothetical protein